MDGSTPLLKAELESLAKLSARQPHAISLKEYFNMCFGRERLLVIREEASKREAMSITEMIASNAE